MTGKPRCWDDEPGCNCGGYEPVTAVPPRPAAPDATAGGLRSAIYREALLTVPISAATASLITDAVLALPALRDVLAAAARDAELRKRVEELAERLDLESKMYGENADHLEATSRASAIGRAIVLNGAAHDLRRALDAS